MGLELFERKNKYRLWKHVLLSQKNLREKLYNKKVATVVNLHNFDMNEVGLLEGFSRQSNSHHLRVRHTWTKQLKWQPLAAQRAVVN